MTPTYGGFPFTGSTDLIEGMVAFTIVLGAVIVGYLTVLSGVLFYLGFSSLGADTREADLRPDDSAQSAG